MHEFRRCFLVSRIWEVLCQAISRCLSLFFVVIEDRPLLAISRSLLSVWTLFAQGNMLDFPRLFYSGHFKMLNSQGALRHALNAISTYSVPGWDGKGRPKSYTGRSPHPAFPELCPMRNTKAPDLSKVLLCKGYLSMLKFPICIFGKGQLLGERSSKH